MVTDSTNDDAPVSGCRGHGRRPGRSGGGDHRPDGQFFLDGLDAGDYDIDLTPPAGFVPDGPAQQMTTITDEGEIRGGIDFAVTPVAAAPTPVAVTVTERVAVRHTVRGHVPGIIGAGPASTSSSLPDTGSDVGGGFVLGALLLVGAGAIVLVGQPDRASPGALSTGFCVAPARPSEGR